MQAVRYINPAGAELFICFEPPYIFEKISGISAADVTMMLTDAAGQDGKSFHELRLADREITVSFHAEGTSPANMYELRQRAIALLSPALHRSGAEGRLIYSNDYGEWWIPCITKQGPRPDQRHGNFSRCTVVWYCPDPYWRAMLPKIESLAYLDGGLEFPLELDTELNIQFGAKGYQNTLYNPGDSPSPVVVTITGPAAEPRITKRATGEYIRVRRELLEGDILRIDTTPAKSSVIIYRASGGEESAFG